MKQSDKKKLEILKKENKLSFLLPEYLNQLVEIEPKIKYANTLEVSKIEDLKVKLRKNNKDSIVIKRALKSEPSLIKKSINLLSQKLNAENYFTIDKLKELWYALLNTNFVLENFEKIIEVDKDLLIIHDKELKNGLWIDLNEELWTIDNRTKYEDVYELKVWGIEWTNLL